MSCLKFIFTVGKLALKSLGRIRWVGNYILGYEEENVNRCYIASFPLVLQQDCNGPLGFLINEWSSFHILHLFCHILCCWLTLLLSVQYQCEVIIKCSTLVMHSNSCSTSCWKTWFMNPLTALSPSLDFQGVLKDFRDPFFWLMPLPTNPTSCLDKSRILPRHPFQFGINPYLMHNPSIVPSFSS